MARLERVCPYFRMMYVQVTTGFVVLLVGAELLVRGAVAVARRLGVLPLVVGMTVVAFGTSAPELVVGMKAALAGAPGIALGNVIGSNIANVLLVLGGAGLVKALVISGRALRMDAAVLVVGSVLFAGLSWRGDIGLGSGMVLLAVFLAFLAYTYWRETRPAAVGARRQVGEERATGSTAGSLWIGGTVLAVGIAGVVYGAELLVEGSVTMARAIGISEEVIGLTLIAIGTSLPELVTSIVAVVRGHVDVALGNVVGSNLFNVLGIVGAVAVVSPLAVSVQFRAFDLWVMLGASLLLAYSLLGHRRLGRGAAAAMLGAYGAYVAVQGYGVDAFIPWLG
ncbi:MAG: calcium/sodium antiporter [Rhodospirillales bacterium]|nr:calcium/sodium antiporter [Rhodospirillales bacterium]